MNKPVFYIVLFTCLWFSYLSAQTNLIPNPSFEEYTECPEEREYSGNGQFTRCKDWWFPTSSYVGTPDYFNQCNNSIGGVNQGVVGVPSNERGYQYPYEGSGMIGFGAISVFEPNNTYDGLEPFSCRLSEPLKACTKYRFRCYITLADISTYTVKGLGFLVTKDSLTLNSFPEVFGLTPNVVFDSVISDTSKWTMLESEFVATGDEEFFTFGYFNSKELTEWYVNDTIVNNYPYRFAYYFVDSMSILELSLEYDCIPSLSNIFTPNGDHINDFFTISGLEISELIILNRWGDQIVRLNQDSPIWDGTSNGIECSEGTYFYKASYNHQEITGFIQLVR